MVDVLMYHSPGDERGDGEARPRIEVIVREDRRKSDLKDHKVIPNSANINTHTCTYKHTHTHECCAKLAPRGLGNGGHVVKEESSC